MKAAPPEFEGLLVGAEQKLFYPGRRPKIKKGQKIKVYELARKGSTEKTGRTCMVEVTARERVAELDGWEIRFRLVPGSEKS